MKMKMVGKIPNCQKLKLKSSIHKKSVHPLDLFISPIHYKNKH